MITKGMLSSNHQDWETPQELFDELDREFHFDIDVCATSENAKCKEFFSSEQDGLLQEWNGNKTYWANPPYGRQIAKWVKKASESKATIVCLLPARTDPRWFHEYIYNNPRVEIRFLKGRLYFKRNGARSPAPFPSMVVIFRGEK